LNTLTDRNHLGPPTRLALSEFVLDLGSAELLTSRGELAGLRKQSLQVLCVLGANAGRVVSKDELLRRVWPDVIVGESSLAQSIADIRRVLGDTDHRLVRTVARRGYLLVPDSTSQSGAATVNGSAAPHLGAAPPSDAQQDRPGDAMPQPFHRRRMTLAGLVATLFVAGALIIGVTFFPSNHVSQPLRPGVPPLSIVVMPFEVEGQHDHGDWLAQAIHQDLIGELTRLENSFVIARDTAATFKGSAADPRNVARELRVRYVVRGSVRRDGDEVRLNLSLIDGESGAQRWADRFMVERARLSRALDEIVLQIARPLSVEVIRSAGERVAMLSPTEITADDLAMRAFALWHRGYTRDNLSESLSLLEQAVAIDPNSIRGWGGLGFVTLNAAMNGWLPDRAAAFKRIEVAGENLDRLDPDGHLSHQSRVIRAYLKKDWPAMLQLSKEWAERHRNSVALGAYGLALTLNGLAADAIAPLELAIRLSPRDVFRAEWHYRLALASFIQGDYDRARAQGEAAAAANPTLPWPPIHAAALVRMGQKPEAQRVFDDFAQRHPNYRQAQMMQRLGGTAPSFVEGRDRLFGSLTELGLT
jgi:TolB-like protein/DNA-binding winged helix-turn-helix (wHTH) protein